MIVALGPLPILWAEDDQANAEKLAKMLVRLHPTLLELWAEARHDLLCGSRQAAEENRN